MRVVARYRKSSPRGSTDVVMWLVEPCAARSILRSIVRTIAILPSPNRICKMLDSEDYANHIHLHTQTTPIPSGSAGATPTDHGGAAAAGGATSKTGGAPGSGGSLAGAGGASGACPGCQPTDSCKPRGFSFGNSAASLLGSKSLRVALGYHRQPRISLLHALDPSPSRFPLW